MNYVLMAGGLCVAGLAVLVACVLALVVERSRERIAERERAREQAMFENPDKRAFLDPHPDWPVVDLNPKRNVTWWTDRT